MKQIISLLNQFEARKNKAQDVEVLKSETVINLARSMSKLTEDQISKVKSTFTAGSAAELIGMAIKAIPNLPASEEKTMKEFTSKATGRTFLRAMISATPGKSSEKEKKFEETFNIVTSEGESLSFEDAVKTCVTQKVVILKGNRAVAISEDSVLFMENKDEGVTKNKYGVYDAVTKVGAKKILGWLFNG
jgi:hypothetical protein